MLSSLNFLQTRNCPSFHHKYIDLNLKYFLVNHILKKYKIFQTFKKKNTKLSKIALSRARIDQGSRFVQGPGWRVSTNILRRPGSPYQYLAFCFLTLLRFNII